MLVLSLYYFSVKETGVFNLSNVIKQINDKLGSSPGSLVPICLRIVSLESKS